MGEGGRYAVAVRANARAELLSLRVFERRKIEAAIESLRHEPFVVTRNRKPLPTVRASFEFKPPLWELRVGEFRIFYDGGGSSESVFVHAVRRKPPGKMTEEITS